MLLRDTSLTELVQKFWQQEEGPKEREALSPKDEECESFFLHSHSRSADDRYVVRLPARDSLPDLSGTRRTVRVLLHMERNFLSDGEFGDLYREFMRQYKAMEHMTLLQAPNGKEIGCYLPHHGVMRETSTTTKLRVVFNSSSTVM